MRWFAAYALAMFLAPGPALADNSGPTEPSDDEQLAFAQEVARTLLSGRVSPPAAIDPPDTALEIETDLDLRGRLFQGPHPLLHTDAEPRNLGLGLNALESIDPNPPKSEGAGNTAIGHWALRNSTSGLFNTAVGTQTLYYDLDGSYNTAVGAGAGFLNNGGDFITAVGFGSLLNNTTGTGSTAVGANALLGNNTGAFNAAVGANAMLSNRSGETSVAVGAYALANTEDNFGNIAVGYLAGADLEDGNDNIYLGNRGATEDSGTIRIGDSDKHSAFFTAGVRGTNVGNGIAVLVGSAGRLGTTTSSRRFKEAITDMGDASTRLLELRPVRFRYRKEAIEGDERPIEFGLIAEEVADIYPDLVAYDEEGRPYSMRYHVLPVMLLNELQRQQRQLAQEQRELEELRRRLSD